MITDNISYCPAFVVVQSIPWDIRATNRLVDLLRRVKEGVKYNVNNVIKKII